MAKSLLIRGATVITVDRENRILDADVLIDSGRISRIATSIKASGSESIDGSGCVLLPGFVQTHIHLCQTLFRGAADDLSLIDWLQKRIWPLEAAHTSESLFASARLGIAELIRGGTTCALTMETVHHTEAAFEAVEQSGFRATIGKCMMDEGDAVPENLHETADSSISESLALFEKWHGRHSSRIRCCFAPRFAVSCSRALLERVAALSKERRVLVHTHASESKQEIAIVEQRTGRRNVEYLNDVGLLGRNVVLAHCIHLSEPELDLLRRTETNVSHCPSSNLKLGSGIARVIEMLERGIPVSLGADGAPCNNRLDMFTEMRTAALLQKALHGPESLPATSVLQMATIDGARALGISDRTGSIEVGKQADLVLLRLNRLHSVPYTDPVSATVYSAEADDVDTVLIEGRIVLREGKLSTLNEQEVIQSANNEARRIQERAFG